MKKKKEKSVLLGNLNVALQCCVCWMLGLLCRMILNFILKYAWQEKKQMSFEYLDDVCLLPYIIAVISAKRLEYKRIGYLMLPTNFPKTVFSQILKTVFCKTIPLKNRLEALKVLHYWARVLLLPDTKMTKHRTNKSVNLVYIYIYIYKCSKNRTGEEGYTVEKKGAGLFI